MISLHFCGLPSVRQGLACPDADGSRGARRLECLAHHFAFAHVDTLETISIFTNPVEGVHKQSAAIRTILRAASVLLPRVVGSYSSPSEVELLHPFKLRRRYVGQIGRTAHAAVGATDAVEHEPIRALESGRAEQSLHKSAVV